MEELVNYIVKESTGIDDVEILTEEEDERIIYLIKVPEESIGLVIGKNGNTIKTLRKLLKIRATLEGKRVDLRVA